jgi:hypothetical protein
VTRKRSKDKNQGEVNAIILRRIRWKIG